ncbi:hypothetical protein RUND412_004220 [Rhizina undulata]
MDSHRHHRHSRSIHSHSHSRSRSRSPNRRYHRDKDESRSRERHSSHRHRSRDRSTSHLHSRTHYRHSHKRTRSPSPLPVLPFNAQPISKHDFNAYREIFADYLDIQKGLVLDELEKPEAKGRFKRFVTHYNRGDLARGWYERVCKGLSSGSGSGLRSRNTEDCGTKENENNHPKKRQRTEERGDARDLERKVEEEDEDESSEDEMVGPFLPGDEPNRRKAGPAIPTLEDLELQQEQQKEDQELSRLDLQHARRQDRKQQREQLDELVPRAEAGTRERQLEKKKGVNEKMRAFREKSAEAEVDDNTLMGGTDSFKLKKAALERKKNERELRKEQLLRARIAEREERLQRHREKEDRTMAMLKQLATRFQH